MNFGIIASMCRDCAQMENGTSDKVLSKEAIARTISEVLAAFQEEYGLEIMCKPKYEYWRDVLTHAGSVCARCKGSDELVAHEIVQYIRKDSRPPDLKIVKKKKPATVTHIFNRTDKQ